MIRLLVEPGTPEFMFMALSMEGRLETHNLDFPAQQGRETIYISLGSLNTDFLRFYQTCIAAFGGTDDFVCMSVGNKIDLSALGDVPENMVIDHFLPQLAILKRADVFIAHAGFNSVHEAMYFGVPMLALPQVNDQHMVAKRVVALGLGVMEDMTALTPDSLRTKIDALLEDRDMKDKCMRMSEDMKAAAEQDTTVQHLEADAASWRAVR